MMHLIPTLADTLDKIEGDVPCPGCTHPRHPMEMRDVRDDARFDVDFICNQCYDAMRREWTVAVEAELADMQRVADPWGTPLGLDTKARRNRLISDTMWAVDQGTSPLAPECQDRWREYVRALNRLTVDYLSPELVEWPVEPSLEYAIRETS